MPISEKLLAVGKQFEDDVDIIDTEPGDEKKKKTGKVSQRLLDVGKRIEYMDKALRSKEEKKTTPKQTPPETEKPATDIPDFTDSKYMSPKGTGRVKDPRYGEPEGFIDYDTLGVTSEERRKKANELFQQEKPKQQEKPTNVLESLAKALKEKERFEKTRVLPTIDAFSPAPQQEQPISPLPEGFQPPQPGYVTQQAYENIPSYRRQIEKGRELLAASKKLKQSVEQEREKIDPFTGMRNKDMQLQKEKAVKDWTPEDADKYYKDAVDKSFGITLPETFATPEEKVTAQKLMAATYKFIPSFIKNYLEPVIEQISPEQYKFLKAEQLRGKSQGEQYADYGANMMGDLAGLFSFAGPIHQGYNNMGVISNLIAKNPRVGNAVSAFLAGSTYGGLTEAPMIARGEQSLESGIASSLATGVVFAAFSQVGTKDWLRVTKSGEPRLTFREGKFESYKLAPKPGKEKELLSKQIGNWLIDTGLVTASSTTAHKIASAVDKSEQNNTPLVYELQSEFSNVDLTELGIEFFINALFTGGIPQRYGKPRTPIGTERQVGKEGTPPPKQLTFDPRVDATVRESMKPVAPTPKDVYRTTDIKTKTPPPVKPETIPADEPIFYEPPKLEPQTGVTLEQEASVINDLASKMARGYKELTPEEQQLQKQYPNYLKSKINEVKETPEFKQEQIEQRRAEKQKRKLDDKNYVELSRQFRQAQRKRNTFDIEELSSAVETITTPEIRTKAEKLLQEAEKHNENLIKRNEFTLENLSRRKFGTTDINSLTEDKQQDLLNEYNEMRKQGIKDFKQLRSIKPTIEKGEPDAIQEQSAAEILVQPKAGDSGEIRRGDEELQEITGEEAETEITEKKPEEVDTERASEEETQTVKPEDDFLVDTEPTEAQIEAGNYKKGHIKRDGLDISLENLKGSTRSGTDKSGKKWEVEMKNDYGYIKGTVGKDKDHLDVFLAENYQENAPVFIVDQITPEGKFDEHKVMLGFTSMIDAERAYISNYEEGKATHSDVTEMSMDEFKKWSKDPNQTKKPAGEKTEEVDNNKASIKRMLKEGKSFKQIAEALNINIGEVIKVGAEKSSIGVNRKGDTLFEDEKGVRYKLDGNIRISEPVSLIPTKGGIVKSVERKDDDWLTVDELKQKAEPEDKAEKIPLNYLPSDYEKASNDYYVKTRDKGDVKIEGSPVNLKYEGDYFAHKSLDDDNIWIVSEGISGQRISFGKTKSEAIEEANRILDEAGATKVVGTFQNAIKANGVTPRYKLKGKNKEEVSKTYKVQDLLTVEHPKTKETVDVIIREIKGDTIGVSLIDEYGAQGNNAKILKFNKSTLDENAKPYKPPTKEQLAAGEKRAKELLSLLARARDILDEPLHSQTKSIIRRAIEDNNLADLKEYVPKAEAEVRADKEKAESEKKQDDIIDDDMDALINDLDFQLKKPTDIKKDTGQRSFQLKPGEKIPADKQLKAIELIGKFIEKDTYKFDNIVNAVRQKYGDEKTQNILPALKSGYGAYLMNATDAETAKMDSSDYVKKFTLSATEEEVKKVKDVFDTPKGKKPEIKPDKSELEVKDNTKVIGGYKIPDYYITGTADLKKEDLIELGIDPVFWDMLLTDPDAITILYKGKQISQEEVKVGDVIIKAFNFIDNAERPDVTLVKKIIPGKEISGEMLSFSGAGHVIPFSKTFNNVPQFIRLEKATVTQKEENTEVEKPDSGFTGVSRPFIQRVREEIRKGNVLNKTQLEKLANEFGITDPNVAKEQAELAIVAEARKIINETADEKEAYDKVVEMYKNQPNLTHRTSESVAKQQYSTPAPIALAGGQYVADGVGNGDVLEPSAGNGMLVIAFNTGQVYVNEIDPVRNQNLRQSEYEAISNLDAEKNDNLFNKKFDGIVTNPPFGSADTKKFNDYKLNKLEHIMAANALKQMKKDGRAAIIIGGHNRYDNKGRLQSDRTFFNWLYHHHNVDAVLNIDGELYRKQGTQFPIRMILINGKKEIPQGAAPLFDAQRDAVIKDFEELYNKVKEIRDGTLLRPEADAESGISSTTDVRGPKGQGVQKPTGTKTISEKPTDKPDGEKPIKPRGTGETGTGLSGGGESLPGRPSGLSGEDTGQPSIPGGTKPQPKGGGEVKPGRSTEDIQGGFDREPAPTITRADIESGKPKVDYVPQSKGPQPDVVIPRNMSYETFKQLRLLAEEVGGDIDQYVVDKLNYKDKDELFSHLGAEQIDAVALGIAAIDKGQGDIIGDMAGVGKGRVAASLVRYGVLNGYKPIFITEKPRLFSDFYRDMKDTGNKDLVPFITNDTANADMVDAQGNLVYARLQGAKKVKALSEVNIGGADYVVATYSQVQNESSRAKRTFLKEMARDNIIIMDESHNASGDGNTSEFFKSMARDSKGVVYLSATFAKRPNNMPVYAMKTAMQEANLSESQLIEAIERGGVALQEILSADLVEAQQMIRREKSYDGIKVEYKPLENKKADHTKIADSTTEIIRDVIRFQNEHIKPIIDLMDTEAAVQGAGVGIEGGTNNAGVDNVPFASKVFNVIDQLLFSLKADETANEAIEAFKRGQKPVIAVKNTMESFLEYLGVQEGDILENADFSTVLERALRGVFRIRERDAEGNSTPGELSVNDLSEEGRKEFKRILDKINDTTTGITISPIDHMIYRLNKAGYKVGEVTGRKIQLKFRDDGKAIVQKRVEKDINKIFREFNNWENPGKPRGVEGYTDIAMILNSSGSTGGSAHSSPTFKDQRQRVMLTSQIELNINTEIQKRGRVNRKGQVVLPEYITLSSAIPAEQRLLMMAKKKLKSLDANVSSDQSQAGETFQVNDFLNRYGDEIVIEYLKENREMNDMLLDPFNMNTMKTDELERFTRKEGAASKTTGRVAILPTHLQEEFYSEIGQRYDDHIKYLDSIGENDLEVKVLPLDAVTVSSRLLVAGKGGRSPFGRDSILETVEVNVLQKPYRMEKVNELLNNYLEGSGKGEKKKQLLNQFGVFWQAWTREHLDRKIEVMVKDLKVSKEDLNTYQKGGISLQDLTKKYPHLHNKEGMVENEFIKYQQLVDRFRAQEDYVANNILGRFSIGDVYKVPLIRDTISPIYSNGIFLGWNINPKRRNPYAPSAIMLKFAVTDSRRVVEFPGSKRDWLNDITSSSYTMSQWQKNDILEGWDESLPDNRREIKQIVVGNILQAFGGRDITGGQLISYTTKDGGLKRGILVKDAKSITNDEARVPIKRAKKFIQQLDMGDFIESAGGEVTLTNQNNRNWIIEVPASKKRGGKFYLDESMRGLVRNGRFDKRGNVMMAEFKRENLDAMIDLLQDDFGISVRLSQDQIKQIGDDDISYQLVRGKKTYKDDFGNDIPAKFSAVHEWKQDSKIIDKIDKFDVEIGEAKIVYWTKEKIKSYDYSDDFIKTLPKLEKGDYGYEPGKEKYAVEIAETNYFDTETGRWRVTVSSRATPSAYTEGIIHQIQRSLEKVAPEMARRISEWETDVREAAKIGGIEVPQGSETFAQAMVFSHLGYASENPDVAELFEIPPDIYKEFIGLLNESKSGKENISDLLFGTSQRGQIRLPSGKIDNSLEKFRQKREGRAFQLQQPKDKRVARGLELYNKLKSDLGKTADVYPEWRKQMREEFGKDITKEERKVWNEMKGYPKGGIYIEYLGSPPNNPIESALLKAYNRFDNRLSTKEEILDPITRNDQWIRNTQNEAVKDRAKDESFLPEYRRNIKGEEIGKDISVSFQLKPAPKELIEKVKSKGLEIDSNAIVTHKIQGKNIDYITVSTPDRAVTRMIEVNKVDQSLETFPKSEGYKLQRASQEELKDAFNKAREQYQLKKPFYSKLEKVLEEKLPASFTKEHALNTIKSGSIKEAEIKWSGIEDWLKNKSGKITKAEVLDFLKANELQIKEVQKGGEGSLKKRYIIQHSETGEELDGVMYDSEEEAEDALSEAVSGGVEDAEGIDEFVGTGGFTVVELEDESEAIFITINDQDYKRIKRLKIGEGYERLGFEITREGKKEWKLDKGEEYIGTYDNVDDLVTEIESTNDFYPMGSTKYSTYVTPGGENYREFLFTLPKKEIYSKGKLSVKEIKDARGTTNYAVVDEDGKQIGIYRKKEFAEGIVEDLGDRPYPLSEYEQTPEFKSSHWDEPNIIAHARVNDRIDADGKKVLFIEELQSDWALEGRKKGFKKELPSIDELKQAGYSVYKTKSNLGTDAYFYDAPSNASRRLQSAAGFDTEKEAWEYIQAINENLEGVPDFPFKNNWHEFVLKSLIRKAAESGYDGIGWVTGEITADRYDLSKQVDEIAYWSSYPGRYEFKAIKNGKELVRKSGLNVRQLEEQLGKDIAKKIVDGVEVNNKLKEDPTKHAKNYLSLSGMDLKIGGAWATNLYDKVIPNFLNKYGKKWNAKVGSVDIGTSKELKQTFKDWLNSKGMEYKEEYDDLDHPLFKQWDKEGYGLKAEKVHSLDITPEMKQSVLYEGQPMFQLKKPKKDKAERFTGRKLENEIAREKGIEPETGEGNIVDFGVGLGQVFTATADKINEFVNNKKLEKEFGIQNDSKAKKFYREFLTAPQWFFDKEPQLRRVWDIIDRHFVRNVNEEIAILTEDKWLSGKGWRDLTDIEHKEFLAALKEYEFTQYELQRDGEPLELLDWANFADEFALTPRVTDFLFRVYKPVIETALDMVKDVDRYKIVNETKQNPYLQNYYEAKENKVSQDKLDAEFETSKEEFFNDSPNAEALYENELANMVKNKKPVNEIRALELAWANNPALREVLADILVDKKYEAIDGKTYFPSSRLDKKYYLSGLKKTTPEQKLIEGRFDDKFFTTADNLSQLNTIKAALEGQGYKVKVGKFAEAQEEILMNAVTQEDILDLAISAGVDQDNPVLERLVKAIQTKGFSRHFIPKRFIPGFEYNIENFETAIYRYINSVPFYKNRTIGGRELAKTMTDLKNRGILKPGSPNDRYIHDLKTKIENRDVKLSQGLRAVAATYYLALSPAYISQQIVQPLNTLLPLLPVAAKELKLKPIEAEKAFGEALFSSIQYWAWKVYDKANRLAGKPSNNTFGLDRDFLMTMRSLERQGVGKPLRSLELVGHKVDPEKHYTGDIFSKGTGAMSLLAKIVGMPGIAVEDFTRTIGIRALYTLGTKAGLKGQKLQDFISVNIAKSYGPASGRLAKPPGYYIAGEGRTKPMKEFTQSVIESWLTFKNFAFMNYGQWGKTWRSLKEDTMFRPMAYKLGAQVAMGGLKYMMWTSTILTLMSGIYALFNITEDPEEQYENLFKQFNKLVPGLGDALYKGLSTLHFNVDVSALFAQTAPVEEPFTKDAIELIGGAPASAIKDIVGGRAPRAARGFQMADRYEKEGIKLGGRKLIPPEEVTEKDKTLRKLGYTPKRISDAYAKENTRQFKSSQYTDKLRSAVKNEIIPLIEQGKGKEAREIFKKFYEDMKADNIFTEGQKKSIIGVNSFISQAVLTRLETQEREIIKKWKNSGSGTSGRSRDRDRSGSRDRNRDTGGRR